jgi:hypothetical protein
MSQHTELYCPTLAALDPVQAIRAIHHAYLQLVANTGELPVTSHLDNQPALQALAACLAVVGHPGFVAEPQPEQPKP